MSDITISITNSSSDIEDDWEVLLPTQELLLTRKRKRTFNSEQEYKRYKHVSNNEIYEVPYVQYHQDKVTKMYIGVFALLMILCMILIICIEYYKYNTLYNTYLITHNKTISYSLFTECYPYRNMEYIPEKCL